MSRTFAQWKSASCDNTPLSISPMLEISLPIWQRGAGNVGASISAITILHGRMCLLIRSLCRLLRC